VSKFLQPTDDKDDELPACKLDVCSFWQTVFFVFKFLQWTGNVHCGDRIIWL